VQETSIRKKIPTSTDGLTISLANIKQGKRKNRLDIKQMIETSNNSLLQYIYQHAWLVITACITHLSTPANTTGETTEWYTFFVSDDILQVGNSTAKVHVFDVLSRLPSVLQCTRLCHQIR